MNGFDTAPCTGDKEEAMDSSYKSANYLNDEWHIMRICFLLPTHENVEFTCMTDEIIII